MTALTKTPLVAGISLCLTQAAFCQIPEESDTAYKSGLATLRSVYSLSTPNSVEIVLSSTGGSSGTLMTAIPFLQAKSELRIRGSLSRELYKKGVCFIQINRDPESYYWSTNGDGLVFIRTGSGDVRTQSFKISSFQYNESHNKTFYGNRPAVSERFTTSADTALGDSDAALHVLKEIEGAVAEAMDIPEDLRNAVPDEKNVDELFMKHLFNLVEREKNSSNASSVVSAYRQLYRIDNDEKFSDIPDNILAKCRELEEITSKELPRYLNYDKKELQAKLVTLKKLCDMRFASQVLEAFVDIRSIYQEPLTPKQLFDMDPVSFIDSELQTYLKKLEGSALELQNALKDIEGRQTRIDKAKIFEEDLNTHLSERKDLELKLQTSIKELEKNIINEPAKFDKEWQNTQELLIAIEKQIRAKRERQSVTSNSTAGNTSNNNFEFSTGEKVVIGIGAGIMLLWGMLAALSGGSSRRTTSSTATPTLPRSYEEPRPTSTGERGSDMNN